MRKLSSKQLAINGGALLAAAATGIDAGIAFAQINDMLPVRPGWYLSGPLLAWATASLPVSIALFNRLLHQVEPPAKNITLHAIDQPKAARTILWNQNGRQTRLLASLMPWTLPYPEPEPINTYRRIYWQVPIEEHTITVYESELKAFLEGCWRRSKHQFSRRYWTKKRKPTLWRPRYEAFIRILTESGLIEGRYDGASGRLMMHPHQAILTLRNHSHFRVKVG